MTTTAQPTSSKRVGTIRAALVIALVLAVLIPVGINTAVSVTNNITTAQDDAFTQLSAVAALKNAQIENWLNDQQTILNGVLTDSTINWVLPISNFPEFTGDSAIRLRSHFDGFVGEGRSFDALFLVDREGVVRLSTDPTMVDQPLSGGLDLERAWAENMLIPPAVDAADAAPMITLLRPEVDSLDGTVLAVLGARVSLQALNQVLQDRVGLGISGQTYLVSDELRLLTSSFYDGYPLGTTVNTFATQGDADSTTGRRGLYRDFRDVDVVGVSLPVSSLNATLVAEREQNETFASAFQALYNSLLLAALSVVAAVLVGVWLANRRILQPLSKLTAASRQITGGDLNATADIHSNDEFGLLADTFNSMTGQLRKSIDTLEERVASRTVDLQKAQERAEEASKAKSLFLSNMSHELRTPLNMVIGYTSSMLHMPQMYNNQPLPEIFRADIKLIEENGQYLLGLINDILDLSKIEAGKLTIQPTATTVDTIINGVIATGIGLLKDKPVQIRPQMAEDLPPVWADPMRLRQILLNLLSNAIKFTDSGTISVSAQVKDDRMVFAVTDTGIGIPEQSLAVIFDRFQQIQQKATIQGTGLGLDISQRLAQLHGGEISVESTVGQGSRFSFSIALASDEQIALSHDTLPTLQRSVKVLRPASIPLSEQAMVLLLEDYAEERTQMQTMLEEAGHIVVNATDGAQALDMATTLLPDIIVLDALLADMNAAEFIERLRSNDIAAHIPVLLLADDLNLSQPLSASVALRLRKPVDQAALMDGVQHVLNTRATIGA
ncbi:MAG: ATP-binding protein [Chloroflexota bacterium]|nr:ATP-binding protein [Chloroflexota bacterium]